MEAQATGTLIDIVGIGALNLDYIAASPIPDGYDPGGETAVGEDVIVRALDAVNPSTASLGGSAFNTVYALAQMKLGLRLGYVGVAGRTPLRGPSAVEELTRQGVDTAGILQTEARLTGTCLSLMEHGERTLLTHAGANQLMAQYLERQFDELLAYVQRARIVHVTSFLDPLTPAVLLRLLRALRARHPDVGISFDPGHAWCINPTPEVLGILELSDYVLLNHTEFTALRRLSESFLRLMAGDDPVALVKQPTGITIYRHEASAVAAATFAQQPLGEDEIVDATGAGDVFAAGLLAGLAHSEPQLERGTLLGLRLARHKLRHVGSQGHAGFAALTQEFLGASGQ